MDTPSSKMRSAVQVALMLIALIAVVAWATLVYRQLDIQRETQLSVVARLSDALALHIETELARVLNRAGDVDVPSEIQAALERYREAGDLFNLRVSGADRRVVGALRPNQVGEEERTPLMLDALDGRPSTVFETKNGSRVYCVARPLRIGERVWGGFILYRDLEPTYAMLERTTQRVVWSTTLILVAFIAGCAMLLYRTSRVLRRAREHQQRLARLASLGTLAAGVAHEVRNPLNALALNVDYMRRRIRGTRTFTESTYELQQGLDLAHQEIRRLDQVLNDFAALGKPLELNSEPINLDRAIHRVIQILDPVAASKNVVFRLKLEAGNVNVRGDAVRLDQVLINLLKNAIEASTIGGTVEVSSCVDTNSRFVSVNVEDDGPGLSDEQRTLLFEPYQSTKRDGLGLGLFMSKRIVDAHQGILSAQSRLKGGTAFRVALPLPA